MKSSPAHQPEAEELHRKNKIENQKSDFEIDISSRRGFKTTFRKTNYLGNCPAAQNLNFEFRFLNFIF